MNLYKLLLIIPILFIQFISCSESGVEPEPNYKPGSRDYTWQADTIKAYYVYFNSIWGKTVNDVWMVSGVGSALENIYRYDGTKWYRETRTPIGNTSSLWGTDNNLWISTKDGRIWNYKNNTFTSSPQFKYEEKDVLFFSMAGKNDNEIYAGGGKGIPFNRDGLIYKYNGNSWQLNRALKNYGNIFLARYSTKNDRYYFLAYIDNKEIMDTTRLLEYDGKDIKTIINDQTAGNNLAMNDIDGYLYVGKGKKIYRYIDGKLNDFLEINLPNFGGQTWGRNKNDFFIRMQDGLLHYNGTDLQYLLKFTSNITFGSSMLVLEKDIFLHAFDDKTGYNIIYHGKLK